MFIKYLLVDVGSEMLAKSHLVLVWNLFEEKRDKWREPSRNVVTHRKNIYRDPRVFEPILMHGAQRERSSILLRANT